MKSLINKIIITTDFSAYSENALKTGLAIARRQGAEVSILHVMDMFDYREVSKDLLPNYKREASQFQAIGKYLDMLAARIHSSTGIKISSKVLEGLPSEKFARMPSSRKRA
ncbi:MAG: universal stress protein [Bacteroidales bacterium]|nr:universal stress protein [Bacteroidales bacterium]